MNMQTKEELYQDIITSYLEIKPILCDLEKRNGGYNEAILNEIRALHDHIARCYRNSASEDDCIKELHKAEGHLKRLILDCFKQLNIIFEKRIVEFETDYYSPEWLSLNDGKFWKEYVETRNKIKDIVKSAKELESNNIEGSFDNYQTAYVLQDTIYQLISKNEKFLKRTKVKRIFNKLLSQNWILVTVICAFVPAVLWEIIVHYSEILSFLKTESISLLNYIGKYLLSIS